MSFHMKEAVDHDKHKYIQLHYSRSRSWASVVTECSSTSSLVYIFLVTVGLFCVSLLHQHTLFPSSYHVPIIHPDLNDRSEIVCQLGSHKIISVSDIVDYSTASPTLSPTSIPSRRPTSHPTRRPTLPPTTSPTRNTIPSSSDNNDNSNDNNKSVADEDVFSAAATESPRLLEAEATEAGFPEQEAETRYRVLPIRASVFPPVKRIYLSSYSSSSPSPGNISSYNNTSIANSSSLMVLLTLSANLSFHLNGVHRSALQAEADAFEKIRGELDRFCASSYSKTWSETDVLANDDSNNSFLGVNKNKVKLAVAPVTAISVVSIELLWRDPETSSSSSSSSTDTDIDGTEGEKEQLLRDHSAEGYHLTITLPTSSSPAASPSASVSQCHIRSYSPEGLLHALRTLSQLVSSPRLLPLPLEIIDWPANAWRGLLIDTARHYFPLSSLQRTIDAMQMVKLNTLHLHLTDAQAFPLQLEDVGDAPLSGLTSERTYLRTSDDDVEHDTSIEIESSNITSSSSSSTSSTSSSYNKKNYSYKTRMYSYTAEDLKFLVKYAAARGVSVVPEIDMPAHTYSWAMKHPEILVNCSRAVNYEFGRRRASPQINIYILNPIRPLTLTVIKALLQQISVIFPSPYIHIGGDEVELECWEESAELVAWVEHHNTSLLELFKDFEAKVFEITRDLGKVPIVWQGLLDMGALPSESSSTDTETLSAVALSPSVISPWKCWGGLADRAAAQAKASNHPVVTSACWYLDFDSEWNDYFRVNPVDTEKNLPVPSASPTSAPSIEINSTFVGSNNSVPHSLLDATKAHLVWGGEASMWTEHVDVTNLECRLWPRGGVIASSLWGLDDASKEVVLPLSRGAVVSEADLAYSSASGKAFVAAYIRYRYFLESQGVAVSDITFHEEDENPISRSYLPQFYPKTFSSEKEVYSYLDTQNTLPISGYKRFDIGTLHMTSQCPVIDMDVFRPLSAHDLQHVSDDSASTTLSEAPQRESAYRVRKIVQINVADGFAGNRRSLMTAWLKEKASEGVDIIGMCELNNWHKLESTSKLQTNFPIFRSYAASVGFVYSHVFNSPSHPYNIGILAALPFQVLREYGPPLFERGVLHVYFQTINLHVFVTHLNAHDSILRENETFYLASIISPLTSVGEKVIVMGDMNSLSSADQYLHKEENFPTIFNQVTDDTYSRLQNKLCNRTGYINYLPIENLLKSGIVDSCAIFCESQVRSKDVILIATCMRRACSASEPTLYNPEWPASPAQPKMRLDFILVSPALLGHMAGTSALGHRNNDTDMISLKKYDNIIAAGIEISNKTKYLSDHFPVYFHWREETNFHK